MGVRTSPLADRDAQAEAGQGHPGRFVDGDRLPLREAACAPEAGGLDLRAPEDAIRTSTFFAWLIVAGLPLAGLTAALWLSLPPFASLMAGCFLMAAEATCCAP